MSRKIHTITVLLLFAFSIGNPLYLNAQQNNNFKDKIFAVVDGSKTVHTIDPVQVSMTPTNIRTMFKPQTIGADTGKDVLLFSDDHGRPRLSYYFFQWKANVWLNKRGLKQKLNKQGIHPNGTPYAMENSPWLYSLSIRNGKPTLAGKLNGMTNTLYGDLTFSPDSTLYILTVSGLYSVDLTQKHTKTTYLWFPGFWLRKFKKQHGNWKGSIIYYKHKGVKHPGKSNKHGQYQKVKITYDYFNAVKTGRPKCLSGNVPTGLVYATNGKLYATVHPFKHPFTNKNFKWYKNKTRYSHYFHKRKAKNSLLCEIDPNSAKSKILGPVNGKVNDLAIGWHKSAPPSILPPGPVTVSSVCKGLWKINNQNSQAVNYTWKINNTQITGSGQIAANATKFIYTNYTGPATLVLMIKSQTVDTAITNGKSCPCKANAKKVISYHQGKLVNSSPVSASNSDPSNALGQPNQDHFSLGFKKNSSQDPYIILSFEEYVSGNLTIYERTTSAPFPEEKAKIFVSPDLISWTYLGDATNQNLKNNDLHPSTFSLNGMQIKYVKIVDRTDISLFNNYQTQNAFDVAGICASKQAPGSCSVTDQLYGMDFTNGKGFSLIDPSSGSSVPVTPNIKYGTGACTFYPGLNRIYYAEKNSPYRIAYYDFNSQQHVEVNSQGTGVLFNKMDVGPNGAIFAMGNSTRLYKLDPNTGQISWTQQLNTSKNLNGGGDLAFSSQGKLYLLTKSGFYRINLSNYKLHFIGKPSWLSGYQATGMEFGSGGTLFATDSRQTQSYFYTLDTTNGQTTQIGTVDHEVNDLTLKTRDTCINSTIFGSDAYTHNIYTVDQNSGNALIADTSMKFGTAAIAYHRKTGRIYYMNRFNPPYQVAYFDLHKNNHVTLNSNTGLSTQVIRMDVTPDDSIYFMTDDNRLFSLNSKTGATKLLGNITGIKAPDYNGDIAFSPNGQLYLLCRSGLHQVNLQTLQAHFIGKPSWISSNHYPSGLVFDGSGKLYASDGMSPSSGGSNIYVIDPSNANSGKIGQAGYQINDLAVYDTCCNNSTSQNSSSGTKLIKNKKQGMRDQLGEPVQKTSSIEDFTSQEDIRIYPNPVRKGEEVRIKVNSPVMEETEFFITDVFGRTYPARLANRVNNKGIHYLNTSNLKPGIYFIHITRNGNSLVKRLIVN